MVATVATVEKGAVDLTRGFSRTSAFGQGFKLRGETLLNSGVGGGGA